MLAEDVDSLYGLLFDRDKRLRFLEGGGANGVLATIDADELRMLATKIFREVAYGVAGNGGLFKTYARALSMLERSGTEPEDVCYRFLASEEFEAVADVPYFEMRQRLSSEEAFYRHLLSSAETVIGSAQRDEFREVADHEFLMALFSTLTIHGEPSFEIGDLRVRRNSAAYYAFLPRAGYADHSGKASTVIYAATTRGQLVHGPLPARLERLVALGSRSAVAAAHDDIPGTGVRDAADRLARLGLIAAT